MGFYTFLLVELFIFKWNIKNGLLFETENSQSPLIEYCEGESFVAECAADEVIVIEAALYGRMKIGNCIKKRLGEMNCQIDVRGRLDSWCSGRRRCDVRVASVLESLPEEARPCSQDVRSYLAASYTCVQVIKPKENKCLSRPEVITQPRGYLSNRITQETDCGSFDHPWTISLQPGLRMRLTLYDFSYADRVPGGYGDNTCTVYMVLTEIANGVDTVSSKTVCAGSMRERIVTETTSNELEVRTMRKERIEDLSVYYLLKYEAFGCYAPPKPKHGWVKVVGNTAFFGCNASDVKWSHTCADDVWKGENRTCVPLAGKISIGGSSQGGGSSIEALLSGSQWTTVIIIGCIALTIGVFILMAGLFYIRRKKTVTERRNMAATGGTYQRPALPDFYSQPADSQLQQQQSNYTSRKSYPPLNDGYAPPFTNDYMRTWQMQRHHSNRADDRQQHPLPHPPPQAQVMSSAPGSHGNRSSDQQKEHSHSQIDGRPMSEHIYESPKFDRKFKAVDGFEPILGLNSNMGRSNRNNSSMSSSHHTA